MHTAARLALLVLAGIAVPAFAAAPPETAPGAVIAPAPPGPEGPIVVVRLEQAIHAATAEYLLDGLRHAEGEEARLLVVMVNTPGGLLKPTLEISDRFLSSRVPIAYFVAPRGAMAASAGFILSLAADVVAMSSGTTLGAASVVTIQGQGAKDDAAGVTGLAKTQSILAAKARTMAEHRGRPAELAEKAITEARAWSETEAREAGFADLLAENLPELVAALDGRTVRRWDGREEILRTAGAPLEEFGMTRRQKALSSLANPELLAILLMIGILGVLVEFNHPGLVFPAVVGGVCLLVFAYGAQVLPVNVVGLLLMATAVGFFIAEVKVTSHGLLGLGGIICLVLGGLMLFDTDIPQLRIDPWFIVPVAATVGALILLLTLLVARAQTWRVTTGAEGLVGEPGTAITPLDPRGKVFVHGAYWDAISSTPVAPGGAVRVRAVEGMRLRVEPDAGEESPGNQRSQ